MNADELASRVARLERSNRRLKLGTAACAVVALCGAKVGTYDQLEVDHLFVKKKSNRRRN